MPRRKTTPEDRKEKLLYQKQIRETTLAALSGGTSTSPEQDRTILTGQLFCDSYESPIQVHASDTIEMVDHRVEAVLEPSLTICIMLSGRIEGAIDGTSFLLDAMDGPRGYVWGFEKPASWQRQINRGMKVSKVIISVRAGWLLGQLNEEGTERAVLSDILTKPFSLREWTPSVRAIALARQITLPASSNHLLQKINRESRALDILGEALEGLVEREAPDLSAIPQSSNFQKAQKIRAYIEENDETGIKLADLSRHLGMSVTNMQSSFKQAYGMTVMDYIRERRLVAARDALGREGLSIAQAAHLAGYTSPQNFSTAFKRQFGISPSEIIFE